MIHIRTFAGSCLVVASFPVVVAHQTSFVVVDGTPVDHRHLRCCLDSALELQ